MEKKHSCEVVSPLKKYVLKKVKSSSSKKVAATEDKVFWKSSRSKKVTLQKKYVMLNINFLNNSRFPRSSSSEEVDAVQRYLLRKK